MAQITCVVVTPERTALNEVVDFVALPLYDGEIGIAGDHSPLIGRLGYGELRLKTGSTVRRYYVDGGFVQVINNVVSVLTNRAIPADKIDVPAAREQLSKAQLLVASTDELLEARERAVAQARAQIRTAEADR
jgi:F-type H+-transporting ATPase subunit epsilon